MCFMPLLRFYAHEVYVCNIRISESKSFEGKYLKPTMCMLSSFSHVRLLGTPWGLVLQASLFMGFSRQEYWNGFPCPPPGDPPNPGIEPAFPDCRQILLPLSHRASPKAHNKLVQICQYWVSKVGFQRYSKLEPKYSSIKNQKEEKYQHLTS